jgi:SAM-dependent methyltransferase
MGYINNPTLSLSEGDKLMLNDHVLIDCSDRLHNLSRVPGHRLKDSPYNRPTILDLIAENNKRHSELDPVSSPEPFFFSVIDAMVSDFFMRHGNPLKVCELGCNNGIMSFHIAPLLAEYDPKADYICVCNSIGNDSDNLWLDRIAVAKQPDGLKMLASDFSQTLLRDEYFDLTIINGTVPFDDPVNSIYEAARITSPNGKIICFSYNQYLLDDSFKLFFKNRTEYRFSEEVVIYSANRSDAWTL